MVPFLQRSFYLPLNLIQAQHYSPTRAGAATLPMVLMMFLLSRWAGGLVSDMGRESLSSSALLSRPAALFFFLPGVGDRIG